MAIMARSVASPSARPSGSSLRVRRWLRLCLDAAQATITTRRSKEELEVNDGAQLLSAIPPH
eukprot:3417397-Pyramimonas_sp.AAC.1